ncbi:hypothetical protein GBA52_015373 [Prunus armeniaca]|nr:hypothetical protein GBA52_015373 [Prunus armeniaca]
MAARGKGLKHGGNALETRIPLKWKVLGRVGLSPNPSLRKKGGISAARESPSCSPPPPDAADPYRDLYLLQD